MICYDGRFIDEFIVVKTRAQLSTSGNTGILESLKEIVKKEG